ncbi:MAG: hypothetical protein QG622_932 [Actinomycetota bacterium]|nr:hypothetical protein [Actinomycetota bacterium]
MALAACALLAVVGGAIGVLSEPAQAAGRICDKYGTTTLAGGKYVVTNNNWGDDTTQCITTSDSGFAITTASHNKPTNGAPGSYPAIYAGCHYNNCSTGSGLPMAVSSPAFNSVATSVSMKYPSSGAYDAAYDIWFDPTARKDGQNTGAELMVWLNHAGSIQPAGSKVATVTLAGGTWDVWYSKSGWNIVSYVRTQGTQSIDFPVRTFFDDMVTRGYAQRSWYLTSVQAGFEPWTGGEGLSLDNFTYRADGASAPTSGSSSSPTSSSPTSGSSSPSSSTSESPSSTSATSASTGSSTTSTGGTGGGTGTCTATYATAESWNAGYIGRVTVTAKQALTGWKLTWPSASGQSIGNLWGGRLSGSGGSVTVTNESWNGSLPAGGSATVGFQSAGSPSTPTVTCTAN